MNEISKRKMWILNTNEKEQMLPQPLSTLTCGIQIPRLISWFSLFLEYFQPIFSLKKFYKIDYMQLFSADATMFLKKNKKKFLPTKSWNKPPSNVPQKN